MSRLKKPVCIALVALALVSFPFLAYAVRANWGVRQQGPRLERLGRHEEAAYCYRAALDFYTVIQQLWADAVYDERVDEIYRQYVRVFGTDRGFRGADHEEWQDNMEACLLLTNRDGVARNVEKGRLSQQQRTRLEERVRIYIEDLMDPDHGFGGDFSFSRKAWLLERTGLFWHAAFRRELAGRYAIQVCRRYCAAVADEMDRVFQEPARAKLYRDRAAWWRERGLDELHLCNGDRALARIKGGSRLKRLGRQELLALLRKGLADSGVTVRRAAVRILADLGELELLEPAMKDTDVAVRRRAAEIFAAAMHLPGLAAALRDESDEVSSVAREVLDVKPEAVGPYLRAVHFLEHGLRDERTRAFAREWLSRLAGSKLGRRPRPGALVEYFSHPTQKRPVAAGVFPTVDIGMKLQANFPRVWYDHWDKTEIFPPDAKGPFRLRIRARLAVPADGMYRFYVKTEVPHRATLSIETASGSMAEIISPRNDRDLQCVFQVGMPTHRIDFSRPVPLQRGLAEMLVLYTGSEVRKNHDEHMVRISGEQKAGIQLFWSSDTHLTELVPAQVLFHDPE